MEANNLKSIMRQAISELYEESQQTNFTVDEAAKYSGIGRDSIRKLIETKSSDFPHFKINTKVFINRKMLDQWLERSSESRKKFSV